MPRITGTNNRQSKFLRAFLKNPAGPPHDAWPSPVILRRWLKNPNFQHALNQIQHAYRLQADLELSAASASATALLKLALNPDSDPQIENQKSKIENSLRLLRLSHVRQRFPVAPVGPAPAPPSAHYVDYVELQDPQTLVWIFSQEIAFLDSNICPQLQARAPKTATSPRAAAPPDSPYLSPASCTLDGPISIVARYPGACFDQRSTWRLSEFPQAIVFEDDTLEFLLPQRGRVLILDLPAPENGDPLLKQGQQ